MRKAIPLLLLLLVSCTDSDLQKVGKTLLVASKAIGEVQTSVITSNQQGLISDDTTRVILETCLRANMAGKQATAVTREISKLDTVSREQLIQILKPIVAALQTSITQDIIPIKDVDTRIKVQTGLALAQSSINTIIIILAATGG